MREIGLREIFVSSASPQIKILKFCDYTVGSLLTRLMPQQTPITPPENPARILVIRPGGIGDAIFLLPIFKVLKSRHPGIRIDVLSQQRNAAVFFSQPQVVDHVYDLFSDLKVLNNNDYDMIVDSEQWHYLSGVIAQGIKARVKIGFATRRLRRKFYNITVPYDQDAYELDNFSRLFDCLLQGQEPIKSVDDCFELPPELKSWAARQIPSTAVVVSLASSVPERRLSPEQLIVLSKSLSRRGFHPVLLGGGDALAQGRRLMRQLDDVQVFNFVGKISLVQSAALIKASRIFIGTDSGLLHLAAAVGRPVIALFGAGNMNKWMPQGKGKTRINMNLPCSPCTNFGYGLPVCRGAFPCLRKMDLEAVLDRHLSLSPPNVSVGGLGQG